MDTLGFAVLLLFIALLLVFRLLGQRWPAVFRPIPGFQALGKAIERAVEAGERVHLSLGTGSVIGYDSAPAFIGLAMLSRVAELTAMSDKPVVVTSGDGAMALLAQDTLRQAYNRANALSRYRPISARLLGPTPFSYAASLPTLIASEEVSVHMLIGSFGAEVGLAADFGRRQQAFVLGGTNDAQAQALLYATAEYPLIGEELFAGGAYLEAGEMHRSSLRVQDTLRTVIVVLIVAGTILRTLGII